MTSQLFLQFSLRHPSKKNNLTVTFCLIWWCSGSVRSACFNLGSTRSKFVIGLESCLVSFAHQLCYKNRAETSGRELIRGAFVFRVFAQLTRTCTLWKFLWSALVGMFECFTFCLTFFQAPKFLCLKFSWSSISWIRSEKKLLTIKMHTNKKAVFKVRSCFCFLSYSRSELGRIMERPRSSLIILVLVQDSY